MGLLSRTGVILAAVVATTMLARVSPLDAQLISPGKLASAHGEFEGIRQCTQCHKLRQKGPSTEKCLTCHTPLQTRIERGDGLHGAYDMEGCAKCHRDHLGREYRMMAFDTAAFAHDSVDYALVDAHADIGCRDCHTADLVAASDVRQFKSRHGALNSTFLGLEQACQSCHGGDDPHQDQFAERTCDQCHTERVWDEAPRFDHDSTDYRLTGAHRTTTCEACHPSRPIEGTNPTTVFTGLAFGRCNDCHRDSHQGSMAGACSRCHSTGGWNRINRTRFEGGFDHSTTDFDLRGAHAGATCTVCHTTRGEAPVGLRFTFTRGSAGRRYPKPVVTDCVSCHTDYHEDEFRETTGGVVCTNCHGEDGWIPTSFGPGRHASDTDFALAGRHILVACADCHDSKAGRISFRVEEAQCMSCHEDENPHANQFPGSDCAACHTVGEFANATVDHQATRFPLDGAHRDVPCAACHPVEQVNGRSVTRFTPLDTACKDCHA